MITNDDMKKVEADMKLWFCWYRLVAGSVLLIALTAPALLIWYGAYIVWCRVFWG